jgi:hypothetical protein
VGSSPVRSSRSGGRGVGTMAGRRCGPAMAPPSSGRSQRVDEHDRACGGSSSDWHASEATASGRRPGGNS